MYVQIQAVHMLRITNERHRAVGSILKPVRLFSSIGMTLNLIIEEVVFLV